MSQDHTDLAIGFGMFWEGGIKHKLPISGSMDVHGRLWIISFLRVQ
jgi:hypothetical protein